MTPICVVATLHRMVAASRGVAKMPDVSFCTSTTALLDVALGADFHQNLPCL